MVTEDSEARKNLYGIGVVSRLTGVSRDALRVWERRYGVVKAQRTDSRRRLYSQDDIKRLMLVKALVDSGNSISSVANLSTSQLQERLRTEAASRTEAPLGVQENRPIRVVLIGPSLVGFTSHNRLELDGLDIVAVVNALQELNSPLEELEADLIVLEQPGLFDETTEEVTQLLHRSGAKRMIVVYEFTSRTALAMMRKNAPRVIALRAPINATELRLACLTDRGSVGNASGADVTIGEVPERVFNSADLAKIAASSTTVKCECPQHLVTLIASLTAFEDYSQSCESRNPADAALHAHLHSVAARSRRLVEDALTAVATAEGLLPSSS